MYLVRRYLYFDWDTWEELPGYQQRTYLDQLHKAKPWTTDGGDQDGGGSGRSGSGARSLDIGESMTGVIGRQR